MRKRMAMVLAAALCITLLTGCSNTGNNDSAKETKEKVSEEKEQQDAVEEEKEQQDTVAEEKEQQDAVEEKGVLMMATTTSTADTGLLDYLAELFHEETGWELQYTAVGTGEALEMGKNGDADILLVHAKASEEAFVEEGYGVQRIPVMYNDFVVIGPEGVAEAGDNIEALFTQILEKQLAFVSRGDDSGTDKKEKGIWAALELNPEENPNYAESGQGMGATITMADEQQAFCLTDRGTWLKQKNDGDLKLELEIICEGDSSLLNQYGVIAVSPEKYPEVNNEGANAFIEWICSDEVQELIGKFGVEEYGEPLFVPNAGTDA